MNADIADFYTDFNSDKSELKINVINDFNEYPLCYLK